MTFYFLFFKFVHASRLVSPQAQRDSIKAFLSIWFEEMKENEGSKKGGKKKKIKGKNINSI